MAKRKAAAAESGVATPVPAEQATVLREVDIGSDMVLAEVRIEHLRDADVNAHVMPRARFERLVANIKRRGQMESLLYCAQPGGEGHITIVSGHHRRKAALDAGITTAWVLIDRARLTRSQLIAKQLAHNFLVGHDDVDIVKALLGKITDPDDLLASGAPADLLGDVEKMAAVNLFTPALDFQYQTVALAFLPLQMAELEKYLSRFDADQDLLILGHEAQFRPFLEALTRFAKVKKIRAGATAVAELVRLANEIADGQATDEP